MYPATTPEHYLAGSHHQWGNPDAIARYPVQAALFGHVAQLNHVPIILCTSSKPYGCRSTDFGSPTSNGDGHLVDHERRGVARSGLTSECHLVTTGTPVPAMAPAEWRNGPQGLCDNDDDDEGGGGGGGGGDDDDCILGITNHAPCRRVQLSWSKLQKSPKANLLKCIAYPTYSYINLWSVLNTRQLAELSIAGEKLCASTCVSVSVC